MYSQKINCRKTLTRLIVSMLYLRSLIATGFMLAVSGNGLEIIVCDGPVSIRPAISEHSGHENHHSTGHTENSKLHISPTCSDWSTSSLLVFNSLFELSIFDRYTNESILFEPIYVDESIDSINQIRAPPKYFLI